MKLEMNPQFEIAYRGKMFEVVTWEGKPGIKFEAAVRSPGVRMLIETEQDDIRGILMTKELRREAGGWDFRLPGGKVFDTLVELDVFREEGKDVSEKALIAAKRENEEEAGVTDGLYELVEISKAGASVEWDLYYYLVTNARIEEAKLTEDEKGDIETVFVSPKELFEKLLKREIKEGRSADILWWWLAKNEYIKFG